MLEDALSAIASVSLVLLEDIGYFLVDFCVLTPKEGFSGKLFQLFVSFNIGWPHSL